MTSTIVRNIIAAAITLASLALAGATLGVMEHVTPAAAATRNPVVIACQDFATWQHKPTAANAAMLTIAAANIPGTSYTKADLLELAANLASPSKNAAKYVTDATQYAYEDCNNGSGA